MLLAVIVFCSIFVLAALLLTATGVGASEQVKRTLARLDALLVIEKDVSDEQIDLEKQELLSSIPFLNRLLLRLEIAPQLRRLLYQASVKWTPGGFLLVSLSVWMFSSYFFYLKTGALLFSLLAGLIPACGPLAFVARKRTARFLKFEEGLPAALDLMVSGMRGGHSLVSVLGLVSRESPDPIGPEMRICFDEQNYGVDLRTALENLSSRIPIQDLRIVTTAILIQRESGGNLAEVLEKCAHVIRERFRLKKEIRVKTAQGRLTGWILSLLPVGLGALLFLIKPEVISLLWTRPLGIKMLYTGAIMITAGSLIIRKIVRIRV
jgi:tight adherence protein B